MVIASLLTLSKSLTFDIKHKTPNTCKTSLLVSLFPAVIKSCVTARNYFQEKKSCKTVSLSDQKQNKAKEKEEMQMCVVRGGSSSGFDEMKCGRLK